MGRAFLTIGMGIAIAGCRADARPLDQDRGAGPVAATACGRPPLPPCPLQRWMDANLAPALRDGHLDRLVGPLKMVAAMAPEAFPRWEALALAGATAAASGDRQAVRNSCGACHDTYRTEYRATMRARQIEPHRGGSEL